MNAKIRSALFFFATCTTIVAHASTPAQPVDPTQARPATPVISDELSPTHPAAPSTNAAPAPVPAAISLAIIAESSLKAPLTELAQTWADSLESAPQVPLTLTNSATLLAKVQTGPGYDLIITADGDDLKTLTDKSLVFADGQRSLARNSLVLYGRKALVQDDEPDWFDLIGTEWKKVALGKPEQVASGRAAQRALQKHGLLDDDHKNLYAYAATDALVIAILQRDQADAAFLYQTDAARLNLHGFAVYPLKTNDAPPLFYTAAISRLAHDPALAHAFIDYCTSPAAKPIWAKYGFETN